MEIIEEFSPVLGGWDIIRAEGRTERERSSKDRKTRRDDSECPILPSSSRGSPPPNHPGKSSDHPFKKGWESQLSLLFSHIRLLSKIFLILTNLLPESCGRQRKEDRHEIGGNRKNLGGHQENLGGHQENRWLVHEHYEARGFKNALIEVGIKNIIGICDTALEQITKEKGEGKGGAPCDTTT